MIPRLRPALGIQELLAAWTPSGKDDVRQFEQAFADLMGQRHAIAFPYGRTGLVCLLEALGLKNKEIICPAWTCVVVPHAIVQSGNEPVFVDCAPGDFNMNLADAEEEISSQTGAIIATSIFGQPVDLDALDALRARHPQVPVIQDCAHSFGCEWKGRPVWKSGVASLFALNISKLMTSIFGGMVTTDDDNLAKKLRDIRNLRLTPPPWHKSISRKAYLAASMLALWPPFYGLINRLEKSGLLNYFIKYYDEGVIDMPKDWLVGMTGTEARVGLVQVQKYLEIVKNRRENAKIYQERLQKAEGLETIAYQEGATFSHYTILLKKRAAVMDALLKQGIQVGRLIEYNVPDMPAYRNRKGYRDCSIARALAQEAVNLPLWPPRHKIEKICRLTNFTIKDIHARPE